MTAGDDSSNENEEPQSLEQDSPSVSEEEELCSCGYSRSHHMVSPKPTYTAWGTFWLVLMGVSSVPIRIDFYCRQCKSTFDFITDEKELRKFI